MYTHTQSFPHGLDGKESASNARDLGSVPGWGRSPGEGNGDPLQDSCLENSMDRGAWAPLCCQGPHNPSSLTTSMLYPLWGRVARG